MLIVYFTIAYTKHFYIYLHTFLLESGSTRVTTD